MRQQTSGIEEIVAKFKQSPNPQGAPFGLYVMPDWITEDEEKATIDFLCQTGEGKGWSTHISTKRPTQHFGYRYTITGYSATEGKLATDWGILRTHSDKIEREFPGIKIAQCLANLYFKDSTIGAHRDRETPVVFGISLAGDINMVWTNMSDRSIKYEACIPRRSLYIMCDDAAYGWMHEVPGRKTVKYPDQNGNLTVSVPKPDWYTRVSLTYRHFTQGMTGEDRLDQTSESY